jgi:hypothetical protein
MKKLPNADIGIYKKPATLSTLKNKMPVISVNNHEMTKEISIVVMEALQTRQAKKYQIKIMLKMYIINGNFAGPENPPPKRNTR